MERLPQMIEELRDRMHAHAKDLEFEKAAELRDQVRQLEKRFLAES
ncbi:MAG: UvrB/UvrC motif-containing protein [Salinibacterium sp.]|nr:UvrB/UvrC motif-containing protein [Salinibacterium sp.]